MKKILLIIGGTVLTFFVLVNVASALSTTIEDAIRGLPLGDQVLLIAKKTDELDTKNKELEKELQKTKQELENTKNQLATTEAKLDSQNESLSALKAQNQATTKRLDCEDLKKKTPANGPGLLINRDIVGYYENVSKRLEELNKGITNRPEELESETRFYKDLVSQAKPMYDNYISECGN